MGTIGGIGATGTGAGAAGAAAASGACSGTAASRRSTVPEKPTAASLSRCWLMHGIAPLRPKSGVFWLRAPVDGCL